MNNSVIRFRKGEYGECGAPLTLYTNEISHTGNATVPKKQKFIHNTEYTVL